MKYKIVVINTKRLDAEFEVEAKSEREACYQAAKKLDDVEFIESLDWDFAGDEDFDVDEIEAVDDEAAGTAA